MAKFELLYRYWITDEKGKIVKRSRWRKSKSYVFQFLQLLFANMKSAIGTNQSATVSNVKDITATLRTATGGSTGVSGWYPNLGVYAGSGEGSAGIVVGTGTGAEANDNYQLGAIIAHGTGAGQLSYGSMSVVDPIISAGNVDGVFTRTFYNGSGATITVREIGIYAVTGGATRYNFCIIRDVLPAGVDVLNGQTLTVQYTLRTTV